MKTFTFNVNKKTNTSSNNNNYNTSYIDDIVLSNLKKAVPYAFTSGISTANEDYYPHTIDIVTSPNKKIDIDITVNKKNTRVKDTYSDFIKAVKYLTSHYTECDTYDFTMEDGTPIKIFADEIQIGYTLLPLNDFTFDLYKKLSNKTKKNVIDIYINIKK